MPVTININNLSLVHRASGGVSSATLPDVCVTAEGAPVPFDNVALSRDLEGGTRSVFVDGGHSAATLRSIFARSTGDEPGPQGGVRSGVHRAEASFLTSSPNVRIEGHPASRLTDKMLHNHGNTLNASGVKQDPARKLSGKKGKGARARAKDEVETLFVEVRDAVTKKIVHGPVTVMLGVGKAKRGATSRGTSAKVAFHSVKKNKPHKLAAIHTCYPEGYGEIKVTKNKQKAVIFVQREKLRDVAKAKAARVGVRLNVKVADWKAPIDRNNCGPAEQWDLAKEEFDDVVIATFWSSEQPTAAADPNFGRALAAKAVAAGEGLGIEGTPLFWAAPGKKAKPTDWRPNPEWVETLPEYANPDPEVRRRAALERVKAYITSVLTKVTGVSRWVVINEPMNVICRANSGSSAFLRALMPSAVDKSIKLSKAERRKLDETNRERKRKGKRPLKPPAFLELTDKAIESMVEIIELAHSLADNSLLIIGDYGNEGWDGKSNMIGMRGHHFYRFVSRIRGMLLARGNTKAVGMLRAGFQAHLRSGGQLGSLAAKEPLDFRPSSIRKQVARFKKLGIPCVVTECDLELPSPPKWKSNKYKSLAEEHAALGKTNPAKYFANKKRRTIYEAAFKIQREMARDALAALLSAGNVESFVWWSPDDDLAEAHGGTNFRYHGYLLHRYIGCKKCGASIKVQGRYKKPKYWGAVAAFKGPRSAGRI